MTDSSGSQIDGWRIAWCVTLALVALSGCGGGGNGSSGSSALILNPTQAAASDIAVGYQKPGASPFISFVYLTGSSIQSLAGIEFTIAPKPSSVSKAVDVWYSIGALSDRGDVSPNGFVKLPIFGLYAGYPNQVLLRLEFQDGSSQSLAVGITTAAYVDPNGIYDHPTIMTARAAGSTLGFDFFVIKSAFGSPIVIDTDAEIRWLAPGLVNSQTSRFQDSEFIIGDPTSPAVYQLQLDGAISKNSLTLTTYTEFHHNIDPGNHGALAGVNAESAGANSIESTVVEIADDGAILNHWDLAAILSAYMTSQGDDASAFVRPGVDWFHHNATTYDPTDDSIIVSSRENFVIKLDYSTGNIIWILGDPTKYWYTFPSLRAKALTLAPGGLYPIGQHGVSITSDGLLMLFNDGDPSLNQPAGAPAGQSRTYSAVSAYSIDTASMTAQDVWDFDYGQTLFSPVCSSAYEALGQSILVDYAVTDGFLQARLVGLDSNHDVVFDFEYSNPADSCDTSWNAVPIPFDNLTIN